MNHKFAACLANGLALIVFTFSGCAQTSDTGVNANAPSATAENGNNAVRPDTTSAANSAPLPTPAAANTSTASVAATPDATRSATGKSAPAAAPPQIGSGGNDFFLFTQARAALNADAELRNAVVVVDVRDGVATLTGSVATDAQKQKAAQLVQGVAGFKGVKNLLRLSEKR
jgi:osmotically-inducible protein OsmY